MKLKSIIILLILNSCAKLSQCKILMTNAMCIYIGAPPYFDIDNCKLSKTSNNLTVFNIYLRYLNRSVTHCNIQGVLRRRVNKKFTPTIFNNTFDACLLIRNRYKNRVFSAFYELIAPYVNMDHNCPYEHDVYVKDFDPNLKANFFLKYIPLPFGSYIFDSDWIFGPNSRHKVKIDFDHLKE